MTRRFVGRAIFLRHGQTNYTDVFPDLTPKGKRTIAQVATVLRNIALGYKTVIFVSSFSVRALGSISIIAKALGYRGTIKKDSRISTVIQHDRKKAMTIFKEKYSRGGIAAIDLSYTLDSCYEDAKIFEPRSKVKKRFYKYLAALSRQLLARSDPPCIIHVSHYELLYHFVESAFGLDYKKDKTLGHGEIIDVSFYDIGSDAVVEIEVAFRDKTISLVFNHRKNKIET